MSSLTQVRNELAAAIEPDQSSEGASHPQIAPFERLCERLESGELSDDEFAYKVGKLIEFQLRHNTGDMDVTVTVAIEE